MQTSRTCLVFGILRQILVWCLFSAPDVAHGISVQLPFCKEVRVCSLQCVLHTLTGGRGQRLNRPEGLVRCSDSCQRLLRFLCITVCVSRGGGDSDIISLDSRVTDWWGHWLTLKRESVAANSETGWLLKEKYRKEQEVQKERWKELEILGLFFEMRKL